MTDFFLVTYCIQVFSNHSVHLNPVPFLPFSACLHSDLPQSNQQPMDRTKSLYNIIFFFWLFQNVRHSTEEMICHYFHTNFKYYVNEQG